MASYNTQVFAVSDLRRFAVRAKLAGDFGVCLLLHDLLQSVCMGRSEHGLRDLEVEAVCVYYCRT
jgi:hypothetical protein